MTTNNADWRERGAMRQPRPSILAIVAGVLISLAGIILTARPNVATDAAEAVSGSRRSAQSALDELRRRIQTRRNA